MKPWQVVLYPILVMLILLGCFTVYKRETSMLSNQALLASQIASMRIERDQVNKKIGDYLNGFNARISALEAEKSKNSKGEKRE